MKRSLAPLTHDTLRELHDKKKERIRKKLAEFASVPSTEYFYELVYCLLTPQSSAFHADKAVRLLRSFDLEKSDINPEPLLHQPDFYIRFHKTKSKHLLAMKARYDEILGRLISPVPSAEQREWLVNNVSGLGWKEASHFLRNIGHRELAILDRHILRNLVRSGALVELPPSLNPKRYREIEATFKEFSRSIDIAMDELDLLFWSMETGRIFK